MYGGLTPHRGRTRAGAFAADAGSCTMERIDSALSWGGAEDRGAARGSFTTTIDLVPRYVAAPVVPDPSGPRSRPPKSGLVRARKAPTVPVRGVWVRAQNESGMSQDRMGSLPTKVVAGT